MLKSKILNSLDPDPEIVETLNLFQGKVQDDITCFRGWFRTWFMTRMVLDLFFCHPEFISGSLFLGVCQNVDGKGTEK